MMLPYENHLPLVVYVMKDQRLKSALVSDVTPDQITLSIQGEEPWTLPRVVADALIRIGCEKFLDSPMGGIKVHVADKIRNLLHEPH